MIRNDPQFPFSVSIGYDGCDDYCRDGSSYRYVSNVSVPLLKINSRDDDLVAPAAMNKLSYCLRNPNVIVVKTGTGGHLGWHAVDSYGSFPGKNWADTATVDFIEAVIQTSGWSKTVDHGNAAQTVKDLGINAENETSSSSNIPTTSIGSDNADSRNDDQDYQRMVTKARQAAARLRSRL